MIGQYPRIIAFVAIVTLALTPFTKASCKVGDKVIEVNSSYKAPKPDCKEYHCKEGDVLTSSGPSVCALYAVEPECCDYGYEFYTKLVYGCNCTYPRCKETTWVEWFGSLFKSKCA